MTPYLIAGVLWIACCLAIGLYIRGIGDRGNFLIRTGLRLLLASYAVGLCLLAIAIIYS